MLVELRNEKGGSGKSTTATTSPLALMGDGAKVTTIDLDARQGDAFSRYVENRAAFAKRKGIDLALPVHAAVQATGDSADEKARFEAALEPVVASMDFVIIDTPAAAIRI